MIFRLKFTVKKQVLRALFKFYIKQTSVVSIYLLIIVYVGEIAGDAHGKILVCSKISIVF